MILDSHHYFIVCKASHFRFFFLYIKKERHKYTSLKTIDKQKQGKLNNNQLHPMVRSMLLLLGFLWKNCCHHLFETKNLLDVRFRGLSHTCRTLSRTSRSAEEREGDQTSCVYPHYGAHVQQLAQGVLFYGNAFAHVARLRIPLPTSRHLLLGSTIGITLLAR